MERKREVGGESSDCSQPNVNYRIPLQAILSASLRWLKICIGHNQQLSLIKRPDTCLSM